MKKKKVIIGITGSIAAYKTPDLARLFIKSGSEVDVVMTQAATKFITPLTLESITGRPVVTDIFKNSGFKHLELAIGADLMVVAPATANFIAKAANGIADDALSTVFLACECLKVIAPAMNHRMYDNQVTKQNIKALERRGVTFVGPEKGQLACGEEGTGRLAKLEIILDTSLKQSRVKSQESKKHLQSTKYKVQSTELIGKNFLVTAGGTSEKIDAVRCITNLSSGKTGSLIAAELAKRGASVKLLTSKPDLAPEGVELLIFNDYDDLKSALEKNLPMTDCLVMSAAVSDYKPVTQSMNKIKKNGSLNLELKETADLLKAVAKEKNGKVLIGFAAETENVIENALEKLKNKNLDMIIASDVSKEGSGIGKDDCEFIIFYPDEKKVELGKLSKAEAAHKVVDLITDVII